MSAQHTPGPWHCEYGTDEYYAVYSDGDCPLRNDTEANAHLIAAAPDLIQALEALNQFWIEEDVNPDDYPRYWPLLEAAREAINKAKGIQ